jgi:hypothetical protein
MQQKLQRFRLSGVRSDRVHGARVTHLSMIRRTLFPALAALLAAGALASPAYAQRDRERERFSLESPFQRGDGFQGDQWDRPRQERSDEIPLSQILRNLKRQYGGQHLDARREGDYYIIIWLTEDGRRLTLRERATR